jgi:predicted nucleic acid-binding Zn finger protein
LRHEDGWVVSSHFLYTTDQANKLVVQSREDDIISSGSVKQMLCLPSGKKLWVVIGRDNEYWTDPELGFCSCKDFYFATLSGGQDCYHLKSVRKAMQQKRFTTIEFDDSYYVRLLQAIADDNISLLSRS